MAYTLFISDVHLSPHRPDTTQHLEALIHGPAQAADALYILGDFFDLWLGQDINPVWSTQILRQLQTLADSGTPVYFMHGNHDFLIEHDYLSQYHLHYIEDPTIINLYGIKTILLHGDSLCTLDKSYIRLKKLLRQPTLQSVFRKLPATWRQALANRLKKSSQRYTNKKSESIMDVSEKAVATTFKSTGAQRMIHGHTHRPALHPNQRFVMDAWHQGPSVLVVKEGGHISLHNTLHNILDI